MSQVTQPLAIRVQNLTKFYGARTACREVNLSIAAGTTFGLLGPNGAGKSTLIRILMGLIPKDSGEIEVLGYQDSRSPERRQSTGYVPEMHFIYRWMTVGEVLRFVQPLYYRWDSEYAADLLEKFQLPTSQRVGSLSKGMTAKLGLLVALAHHPQLLILDEPTSGLDPIIREDFLESVIQSNISGDRTVLFSSHHVDDVERVSDKVGIMARGSLVVCGTPDELRERIKRIRVVLRDGKLPAAAPKQTLNQTLARREWTVTVDEFSGELLRQIEVDNAAVSVEVIDLNLEEIFKDVVRGFDEASQSESVLCC